MRVVLVFSLSKKVFLISTFFKKCQTIPLNLTIWWFEHHGKSHIKTYDCWLFIFAQTATALVHRLSSICWMCFVLINVSVISVGPAGLLLLLLLEDWLFDLLCLSLCVGVESPSHAIRADADPLARSATSVVITLADKYTYDCPVKILIYPSGRSTASKLTHSAALQLISLSSPLKYNILK